MKQFRLLAFCIALLALGSVKAQMLTPFVTASAGDFFTNTSANVSLSFTVGEMAMVQTFESVPAGVILTQGFQQPITRLVGVDESPYAFEFVVFPNPASDRLNFRYLLQYPGKVTLSWTDMRGVQVLSTWEDQYTGGQVEDGFDTQNISQGMYFLHVTYDVPGKGIHHKSIHKINIIH
ncbi:MAG: T9SS type A sorting domain-containing protein [Bacteroidia bacterium]